ncbi:MAG: 1-acyl-sn-glycerol-3-phosphate acyltransferase, partial [Proteobacteria bacterium]|nr:1-acyl-sn-glycerol-3-phosphate acyltransferase [Pseudomonadota bacterium]
MKSSLHLKDFSDHDEYRTPEGLAGGLSRRFPGFFFHLKLLLVYVQGWWWAVRGVYDGRKWVHGSLLVIRLLESAGVRLVVENLGLPGRLKGPVVFIANHMSTLETFALPSLIHPRRKVVFIVKESLLKFPFFGRVLKARNPITVGRKNPREDLRTVLEEGCRRLEEGISVIVFPQTTRSSLFVREQFNSIGVKLAKKAGVPVVPIALKTDAWGVGKWVKDFGPIDPGKVAHIAVGEPISVTGTGQNTHQEVIRFIQGKLGEWGEG